jgi:hypothetical protein
MEAIIQARYTNFATDDQDYPNMAFIARKVLETNWYEEESI